MNISIKSITVSDNKPHSISGGGGYSWQEGENLVILQEQNDDTEEMVQNFGFCFAGVGPGGNYGESDDMMGYATAVEAEAAGLEYDAECKRQAAMAL